MYLITDKNAETLNTYLLPTYLLTTTELITNMQDRLVHHLIGTKLRCALQKCTSVQNYVVILDMHVRCQPQKYYILYIMHPYPWKKSVRFVHVPCEPPKNENDRGDPYFSPT